MKDFQKISNILEIFEICLCVKLLKELAFSRKHLRRMGVWSR